MHRISIIDSHTGGEPTRVVTSGFPDLGSGPLAERRERFRTEFDHWRSAIINEPRGNDVLVGALLVEPHEPDCAAGVIFFNNVGPLGMCGHGTIGLLVTLAHLGKIGPGLHRIDTPVGVVTAELQPDGRVAVGNVTSWRSAKAVPATLPDGRVVTGDVAWSGNWFYLVADHGQEIAVNRAEELTALSWAIRQAINAQGYPEIDHVELFGPAQSPDGDSRSFVLCPGKAYDRSPCGTGTSAKLACLAAEGKLAPGELWVQESVIGSTFEASYEWENEAEGKIRPRVIGSAYVNAEATLLLNENDPFCWGIG